MHTEYIAFDLDQQKRYGTIGLINRINDLFIGAACALI
jgi:hypothetical protein